MPVSPEDLCNESLDLIGYDGPPLGDLQEGSPAATTALHAYLPTLRLLLRSAPWNFARKSAIMQLLQDATGNTQGIGTNVPPPFTYEYQFPIDAVKVRFVPWSWPYGPNGAPLGAPANNISVPPVPNFAVPTNPAIYPKPALARFQIAYDDTLPNVVGDPSAGGTAADWASVEGEGPLSKRVVLCDVPAPARCVYTALTLVPETWDPTFREAFVQLLAARFAVPVLTRQGIPHPQAMQIAAGHSAFAKDRALEARALDYNETMGTTDHVPDWIKARRWGAAGYNGVWGFLPTGSGGYDSYSGYDNVSFPALSSF